MEEGGSPALRCSLCPDWRYSGVLAPLKSALWVSGVSPEDEIGGLDMPEMGVLAYPTFPTEATLAGLNGHSNGAVARGTSRRTTGLEEFAARKRRPMRIGRRF